MRVTVDLGACQGHGVCHLSAPGVFDLDDQDGHAVVVVDPVPADQESDARLGADSCPERAIAVD